MGPTRKSGLAKKYLGHNDPLSLMPGVRVYRLKEGVYVRTGRWV
jgi:hypothetical protein